MSGHHHDHNHIDKRHQNSKALTWALIITASIMVLEFLGGWITNSLALMADAGHMLSDTASLALSLVAMWFATRPPSRKKTYGFYRIEILVALLNGATLLLLSGLIIKEAWSRFTAPPVVAGGPVMLIAVVGLGANILSAWILYRGSDIKGNVNLRSAYLHILGDALGSVGAIVAGLLMYGFGWYIADPITSILVAVLVLKSAWGVIGDSLNILMEGTPETIVLSEVYEHLQQINGVEEIHDLHIWTITSGFDAMTCHLLVDETVDQQKVLEEAIHLMKHTFHIEHITIQIENKGTCHSPHQCN